MKNPNLLSIKTILTDLKDLVKSNKQAQFTKANEWLTALQDTPEKTKALQQCFKAFGIPFEKSEEVTQSQTPVFPALPPSYFGKYFNQERYQQAHTICALAYLFENNGIAAEHATKLAVMFDNSATMLEYLSDFAKNAKSKETVLHNACLFSLPNFNESGFLDEKNGCKFELFKAMAAQRGQMLRKEFKEMLPFAWELQKLVVSKKAEAKVNNKTVDQKKIKAKEDLINKISIELDHLERHKNAQDFDRKQYEMLILSLSKNLSELADLSAGKFLKDLSFLELRAFYETYKLNCEGAYKIFIENGIPAQYFAQFKELNRQAASENIPNVIIDGKSLGQPGYYLMKVPVEDELHAARAACFGKMTNCCQSLSGEAGQACVIHGLTSPNGGFYVLCEGDSQQPKVSDKVVAMSWVWRSHSEAIVLDSVEVAESVATDLQRQQVKAFYEHLGRQLVNDGYTTKVTGGSYSGISHMVGIKVPGHSIEHFKDYIGYSDSHEQRIIYSADEPYLFYNVDEQSRLRTDALIAKVQKSDLENSNAFFLKRVHQLPASMLEYLIKQKDFNLSDELVSKIFNESIEQRADVALSALLEKYPNCVSQQEILDTLSQLGKFQDNMLAKVLLNRLLTIKPALTFTDEQKSFLFETASWYEDVNSTRLLFKKFPELKQMLSMRQKYEAIESSVFRRDPKMADLLMQLYGDELKKFQLIKLFGKEKAKELDKGRASTVKKWPTVVVEPQVNNVKPKRPLPQTPQRQHQKAQASTPSEPAIVTKRQLPKPPVKK